MKVKRQATDWEEVSVMHKMNKKLISRRNKKFPRTNKGEKKTTHRKNGQTVRTGN